MKITQEIAEACRKSVERTGSQSELSRMSGVSQQTISDICSVNRRRNNIGNTTFKRLFPFMQDFLPDAYRKTENDFTSARVQFAHPQNGDFIFARITEIYSRLDRAERADLLASAERIAEKHREEK